MKSIKLLFAAAAALFISLVSFAELAIKPDALRKPFEGERFLATGGSIDIPVSTTDSTTGFWRIGVYVAP